MIASFRDDPRRHVLLMSYGAGGVGLNLQFASYVFLFDRWWNPAVEDQAINRAHRIGAAGPVTVTRFLTLDTIEERIDHILQEKRELFDTIFSDVDRRPAGPEPERDLWPVQTALPARADRRGGVIADCRVLPAQLPSGTVDALGAAPRSDQRERFTSTQRQLAPKSVAAQVVAVFLVQMAAQVAGPLDVAVGGVQLAAA